MQIVLSSSSSFIRLHQAWWRTEFSTKILIYDFSLYCFIENGLYWLLSKTAIIEDFLLYYFMQSYVELAIIKCHFLLSFIAIIMYICLIEYNSFVSLHIICFLFLFVTNKVFPPFLRSSSSFIIKKYLSAWSFRQANCLYNSLSWWWTTTANNLNFLVNVFSHKVQHKVSWCWWEFLLCTYIQISFAWTPYSAFFT